MRYLALPGEIKMQYYHRGYAYMFMKLSLAGVDIEILNIHFFSIGALYWISILPIAIRIGVFSKFSSTNSWQSLEHLPGVIDQL
jgi:hypothetical protein